MTIKINKPEIWISSFPIPSKADHKYLRGMVLVNCGPKSKTGAARLAARSAMRVGAGAVKLSVIKVQLAFLNHKYLSN